MKWVKYKQLDALGVISKNSYILCWKLYQGDVDDRTWMNGTRVIKVHEVVFGKIDR